MDTFERMKKKDRKKTVSWKCKQRKKEGKNRVERILMLKINLTDY